MLFISSLIFSLPRKEIEQYEIKMKAILIDIFLSRNENEYSPLKKNKLKKKRKEKKKLGHKHLH